MTYEGQVKNGVIVLDGPISLEEGTRVRIEVREAAKEEKFPPLAERLASVIGIADGLPEDMSENLHRYLNDPPG